MLLDPDPGCLACKRERDRETGGRGSSSRPGTKKETEEQRTEVGTEEEEKEGSKVQKWGQKTKTKTKKRKWGCVFLSFFLSFLSLFFFPFVQDKGFFFSKHFRFCEFGTR